MNERSKVDLILLVAATSILFIDALTSKERFCISLVLTVIGTAKIIEFLYKGKKEKH